MSQTYLSLVCLSINCAKRSPLTLSAATATFEGQERTRKYNEEDSAHHIFIALFALLPMTAGIATASPITYQYSGTFDTGPLAGNAYTGTFTYDTAGSPNLQTGIPLTFSVPSTFDTRQIEAHPNTLPLFTLVDARQVGGFSLHISILHFVSPELDQALPPIQAASVFFSSLIWPSRS